jgi:hypothetical protein
VPRVCSVCTHEDRADIDAALISGVSVREIASRYVALSKDAVQRHRVDHLPDTLLKAAEAEELADADKLKQELETVKADVSRLKDKAEREGDYRTALTGCDKALKALELQARLLQLIQEAPQVNILVSAEWVSLRTTLLYALEPYPDARRSVLRALESDGNGRG